MINLDFKQAKKMMDEKEVLSETVKMVKYDEELETDILLIDLGNIKGIIKREEVDMDVEWKSLVGFVGREIDFVIKEIDEENNRVFLSRKDAQEILRPSAMEELESGAVVGAKVVNILPYGAYLEYKGVSGLLKNTDFSNDHTAIEDVLNLGDIINVKLRNISESGKIYFEVVEKYSNPTVVDFDIFERNQVVLGTIKNIKPFGAFVNIAPGLDALCPIPTTREIEEGMKVAVRITKVDKEKERVRGKIVR